MRAARGVIFRLAVIARPLRPEGGKSTGGAGGFRGACPRGARGLKNQGARQVTSTSPRSWSEATIASSLAAQATRRGGDATRVAQGIFRQLSHGRFGVLLIAAL
jgi:hypothetical protein